MQLRLMIFTLLALLGYSHARKCYQCGSAPGVTDESCSDENVKSKHQPTDCPSGLNAYCMKAEIGDVVSRSCMPACVESDHTFCCQEDGCNGGMNLQLKPAILVTVLITGLVFAKLY